MIMTIRAKSITESKKIKVPDGYEKVNVLSWHKKDTKYYELSPYHLKTDGEENDETWEGILFENFWQGSKVYPYVKPIEVKPNFRSNIIWWTYDKEEVHFEDEEIKEEYFEWRKSVWSCSNPLRYPNSFHRKKECLFSLEVKNGKEFRYDYIDARKKIYCKQYMRLIRKKQIYHELLDKLSNGINLCVVEVDVPEEGKRGYYGMFANQNLNMKKLKKLLLDPSESFGHGLCLCAALLEDLN